jgi:hypothetical protein
MYSAFADKVERNCQLPVPGWNCMTHRQALQGFLDSRSFCKNKKFWKELIYLLSLHYLKCHLN